MGAPSITQDVALILSTLKRLSRFNTCHLAVKRVGHTPFSGSANIDKGVTVDMHLIRGIKLNAHRNITSVGAGERWGNAHRKLDALSVSVSGERVSKAGVAGLTTGSLSDKA